MNTMKTMTVVLAVIGALLTTPCARGATFTAILKDFSGEVEVKPADGEWIPARVGMELAAGDFLTTSFFSSALLELPDGSTAQLDEITQIKISVLFTEEGAVRSDILLRTGGLKATINRVPRVESDFKVTTPTSTISVRGTEEAITALDGFGTEVEVLSGRVNVANAAGQEVLVNKGGKTVVERSEAPPTSPSNHRLEEATVPVADVGHTDEEREEMQNSTEPAPSTAADETASTPATTSSENSTLVLEYEF